MTRKKLLFPEDARDTLTVRFRNQHRSWLSQEGKWPLVLNLGPPTERDISDDTSLVRAWVDAWSSWREAGFISWETKQWPRMGRQNIPVSLALASSEDVARLVGREKQWACARERYKGLIATWPTLSANSVLPRYYDVLVEYGEEDFQRLCSLLIWLGHNPNSNLHVRQLPIPGLDTKWIERRTGLVSELICAIRGEMPVRDFFEVCGLKRPPHRIRVRVLCPNLRNLVGGLADLEASLCDVANLPLSPRGAIIVENLETGLALPDLPGVIGFMKLGNAVSVLNAIPWLQDTDAVYWGDIDTHGYAILNRARGVFPALKSILMDKGTLFENRALWGEELVQSEQTDLSLLRDHERVVWEGLRSNAWGRHVRLEQERIPWACALDVIKSHFLANAPRCE